MRELPLLILCLVVGNIGPSKQRSFDEGEGECEGERACELFSVGVPERQEFYSPCWPSYYPKEANCVLRLQAPMGHLLRVDFLDSFNMEPSDGCKYDILEVRDGAHGYSDLIDKYCGKEFPPVITSSGRSLWMRFKSDNTVGYTGFRARYQYIPLPTAEFVPREVGPDECRLNLTGIEGFVNSTDIESKHTERALATNHSLDCIWYIHVEPGWRIQLWFAKFQLGLPNDCESNFLDIFSDKTDIPSRINNFCGSIADLVLSPANVLIVRYFATPQSLRKDTKFAAIFTAFKEKNKGTCSEMGLYDCEDGNCIAIELKCNSRFNCRYRWDEDKRLCDKTLSIMERIVSTKYMIAILMLFFIILFGMCCAFLYHCIKKLIRDQRIIREQMRRSRDAKLEQLGKKTPAGAVVTPLVAVVGKAPERYSNWPNHRPAGEDDGEDEDDDGGWESRDDDRRSVVEMREVEIQTRESLFHSPGSSPPPRQTFTTFGYGTSEEESAARAASMESTKSAPDVIMSH